LAASKGRIIPAAPAGKFKTTSQIVAIITILVILCVNSFVERFGGLPAESTRSDTFWYSIAWILRGGPYWLTFVTSILTLISGYLYLRQNVDLLYEDGKPKH
jgi:phosphatidylglycerophosphate synthase